MLGRKDWSQTQGSLGTSIMGTLSLLPAGQQLGITGTLGILGPALPRLCEDLCQTSLHLHLV